MKKIVVLTGAGMSAESGISTFRDAGGLWDKYPVEDVATPEGYRRNPQLVTDFYNARRMQLLTVEPNEGHRLVAALEEEHEVTVVTQNVDNLHERAGSTDVIHLHGEMAKVTSSDDRINPEYVKELALDVPINVGDKAGDGSQLRPHIVLFGEYVTGFDKVARIVSEADIFVVIGTSLTVHPAANLVCYAHPEIPKFIINPGDIVAPDGYEHIKENASIGIETFIDRIIELSLYDL
jgi:NAD-dependent deacetylase